MVPDLLGDLLDGDDFSAAFDDNVVVVVVVVAGDVIGEVALVRIRILREEKQYFAKTICLRLDI